MASRLDQIIDERLKKISALKDAKIDPYPSFNEDKLAISQAREMMNELVKVTGRIIAQRGHGGLMFQDIKDESGQIQLMIKSDVIDKKSNQLVKLLDIGDFIKAEGKITKTQKGEISILVEKIQLLTKTLRPLPEKWHGLTDIEERYRKRYLDLIFNDQSKNNLILRSKIISSIREYLDQNGFLEVETPTLQSVYGGGFAKPFITHHNSLDSDFYLRISDEMYLKRLIVGGFEKVYEITKVFRNEGVDHDHNPEFTMFEAQMAFKDYNYGMDIIEKLFEISAEKVLGSTEFEYQGIKMNVKSPWIRLTVVEAIEKYLNIKPLEWQSLDEAKQAALECLEIEQSKKSQLDKMQNIGEVIAFVFEEGVEEKLIQPTIIYDYPVEISPLAKRCQDERFTQRFEMFAFGSELGNNYTELADPVELKKRFIEEKAREKAGFDEAHQTDYDYLTAIEHGFPPTCGIAIGIDRMVMLFANAKNIKEVIAFPTLRPEKQQEE